MKSAEDVESYLMRLDLPYETLKPGIWIVKLNRDQNLAVSIAGPVVAFRIKVMNQPDGDRESLYSALLNLNTNEMVHGAFGLEGDAVVIVHALELENLDFNEFQAVIDDMAMAIAKHYPRLSGYMQGRTAAPVASV
ncbi:MAG TPA: YbjN domain-containing protein [Polyangia bacterium]|jgi:hypothetical protein